MRFAVRYYQDGKWWMAETPAFDAVTQGESLEEARRMALDLLLIHLDDRWEKGEKVRPEASLPRGQGWEWVEVPLRMEVALRIRRERRRRRLTMQQAADAMGVALATYQKWEDPRRCNATLDTLERVARAFGRHLEVAFR